MFIVSAHCLFLVIFFLSALRYHVGANIALVPWAVTSEMGRYPFRDSFTVAEGLVYRHQLCQPTVLSRMLTSGDMARLNRDEVFVHDRGYYAEASLTPFGLYYHEMHARDCAPSVETLGCLTRTPEK